MDAETNRLPDDQPAQILIPPDMWKRLSLTGEQFGLDPLTVLGRCVTLGLYAFEIEGQNKLLLQGQDGAFHWFTMLQEWEKKQDDV